ncbi:hypothetical protein [Clostridium lundense]|uniref:hypothetical protein n=1 Tax=Clostridium lundense TaxID=319475 RepID=UPI000487BED6|nr:hypothetical protein [Clostridium lundense]
MLADPKKQAGVLNQICSAIIYNDTELTNYAKAFNDKDYPNIILKYLPRTEYIITKFEANFTYEDFHNLVACEPVEVRYLLFVRFYEAIQRLNNINQCPCEFPDDMKQFLYNELIENNLGKIHHI